MSDPIEAVTYGTHAVVYVQADVDSTTSALLRRRLADIIRAGHLHVIVDLTGTPVPDSTALGVLVDALKTIQDRGGRLQLVVPTERLAKVLRISGLVRVLPVQRTLEAAMVADLREHVGSGLGGAVDSPAATARTVSQHTGDEANITAAHLHACIAACQACRDQPAQPDQDRTRCAMTCTACARACTHLLAEIG